MTLTRRRMLGALAAAPLYQDKKNLLFYLDEKGRRQPVVSERDWRRRVEHIRANMELVMGPLPAKSTEAVELRVTEEVRLERYTRQRVTYVPEKGDRTPAFLLVPHERSNKRPGMICLPGSSKPGKDIPSGVLRNRPDQLWAHELAGRGYVLSLIHI